MLSPPSSSPDRAILRLDPFSEPGRVCEIWQAVGANLQHSFFLSWGWMAAWLAVLDRAQNVEFVAVLRDGTPIGAFFLGHRRGLHPGSLAGRRAYLNATGHEDYDEITIEYNGALESEDAGSLNCLLNCREFETIEEFNLPAISQKALDSLALPAQFSMVSCRELPSYFVDLAAIRQSGNNYLQWLSRNKRSQLRRSTLQYGKQGSLRTVQAQTSTEALDMLSELRKLHERRWSKLGKPGAFASQPFVRFHRELIESRFDAGEIQLLEIAGAGETVGFLYNFVYDNQVLYYQSGFNYTDSNRRRPGLVCHHQAILHNLSRGRDRYNFLAGDSQFKKSLSTNRETLYNVRISRKSLKLRFESALRRIRAAARSVGSRNRQG